MHVRENKYGNERPDPESQLWRQITITTKNLTQSTINSIITKETNYLDIPYCSVSQIEPREGHPSSRILKFLHTNFPTRPRTRLKFLVLQGFRGEDILAAMLAAKSPDLTSLDLFESRYSLMTTIIEQMTGDNKITSLNLSSIRPYETPEPGEFYASTLRLDTVQLLVDKCKKLTSLILAGTEMSQKAISHICAHITPNLERLNIADELMMDTYYETLSSRCRKLQYLNILGTRIKWRTIITFIPTWNTTMVDLSLPYYMEYVLSITPEHPDLEMKKKFTHMINSMKCLQLLSINQYRI